MNISSSSLVIAQNKHEWTLEGILFQPWKDVNAHLFFPSSSPPMLIYSPVWFVCQTKMAYSALLLVRSAVNQTPCEVSILKSRQNPFKASHLTWRPSLKVYISQACKCSSYLNGETSNSPKLCAKHKIKFHIWNQMLSYKFRFFCSNSIKKILFFRLDTSQCTCAVLSTHLRVLTFSIATGTSNCSCSDAMTLLISDWLFYSVGGASFYWAAILSFAFFPLYKWHILGIL